MTYYVHVITIKLKLFVLTVEFRISPNPFDLSVILYCILHSETEWQASYVPFLALATSLYRVHIDFSPTMQLTVELLL